MIRFILILSLLFPGVAFAASDVMVYKSVSCIFKQDETTLKKISKGLMTLTIDEHVGRFAQIEFEIDKVRIQYQILVEEDVEAPNQMLFLQNLTVGELQSSAEFSAPDVSWIRTSQGDYSAACELKK